MNHKYKFLTLSALGSILLLSEPGTAFAVDIPTTLIQTITTKSPTSGWGSFTSPDPSGIAYLKDRGTLLDCDGEVDEMPALFLGDNLFEISLTGALIDTHTTTNLSRTGFSNEPVGCGYDAIKHELFISDDDQRRVFHIKPGNDGNLFTGDDTRTFFNAPDVCNVADIDAEGLSYGGGALFIIDGVGAEVWRVTSTDGTYDGPGESCTHFDTEALGVLDPEGAEYDEGNPNHLFVVGKPKTSVSYFTTAGTLTGTLDISASGANKPAGLAIAPRSTNSTAKSLYIVDRGVDNDSNPSENDGKIYEFSIAGAASGNQPPAVNAGVNQIISLAINGGPAVTNLDGTVTDDGQPNPPGTVTTTWSKDSGPGSVTFGNAGAVDTTATFNTAGVYVLRLTADDDGAGGPNAPVSNTVQVTVNPSLTISAIYISAAADGTTTAVTGGLAFSDEDIIVYDTDLGTWALYFDGSDVGLGGGTNIDAFHILADKSILLSFAADTTFTTLNGLGANVLVDDSDILRFVPSSIGNTTAGTFEWYFDGSDVGLTSAGEDIDAIAFNTNGKLVISTIDPATPTPAIAGFTPADEDLLLFNDTALGAATSGTWAAFLDGSDVGLSTTSSEDVNGAFIETNGDIFLTTLGAFSVTGASGGGDDIFLCKSGTTGSTSTCTFEFVWSGIDSGLPAGAILDGIQIGPKPSFNAAPVLDAIGNKTVARGSLLAFTAHATDSDLPANALTYSLVNGPVGAVIDAGTGEFSWTPSDSGTYPFTVKVCDDATPSGCDEEAISVSVNSAPVLDAIGNKTVTVGNLLAFTATASDSDIPANTLTFSLLSGAPAGASIDATSGAFSWTPTAGGDFPITVQVCDNATPSLCDSEAFTVTVHANPVLAPIGNKTVTEGNLLSFTATATDANAGDILTFSLDGAPIDANITSDGTFSWTPAATGNATFIVRVCDNTAPPLCDEEQITVTVNAVGANNSPILDPIGPKTVNLGSTLSFTATASDPDPGTTLTFNLEPPIAADAGITSAGAFSWTPSATGPQDFTVRVCDDVAPPICDQETFTVTVNEVVISTINVRVAGGSDDAEQLVSTGAVDLASSDLELTVDGTNQTVGMRFNNIAIPKGAVIQNAYVQFTVDETPSVTETLQVWGQAADNATTFTTAANNISSRTKTAASATWNPAAWPTLGAAGVDQQTPDIKSVIQEIVNRSGWTSGNSLAVIITGDGNGKRVAEAFEGAPSAAPLLHVEYATGDPGNTLPDVNITSPGTGSTFAAGTSIDFAGTAADTEDGTLTGALSWTSSIDNNIGSGASFSKVLTTGTHTITASATDNGGLTGSAQITVTVNPPVGAGSVDIRVNSSSDDAEQFVSNGAMDLPSSDLELTLEASNQTVGLRFNLVNIPQGATIDSASIQFTVDEVNTAEVTALTIHGQADDNAPTFTTTASNISSRPTTAASVLWDPVPGWTTVGLAGPAQKTPDLKAVIQEIVSRPGWVSGHSLAIIVTGSGKRVARAFNGVAAAAPLLHVDYH
ncbi:MAG: putative Ig domain-containing protein [Methylobacter sp.]